MLQNPSKKILIIISIAFLLIQPLFTAECLIRLDSDETEKAGQCGSYFNFTTCSEGYCNIFGKCMYDKDGSKNSKYYSEDNLPNECRRKSNWLLVIIVLVVCLFFIMPYTYLSINLCFCSHGKIRHRFKDKSTCCFVSLWFFPYA